MKRSALPLVCGVKGLVRTWRKPEAGFFGRVDPVRYEGLALPNHELIPAGSLRRSHLTSTFPAMTTISIGLGLNQLCLHRGENGLALGQAQPNGLGGKSHLSAGRR